MHRDNAWLGVAEVNALSILDVRELTDDFRRQVNTSEELINLLLDIMDRAISNFKSNLEVGGNEVRSIVELVHSSDLLIGLLLQNMPIAF